MNQPDPSNESLIAAWLNDSLSEAEESVFSERYAQDTAFARVVDNAKLFSRKAPKFSSPAPPLWDKESAFPVVKKPWLQWQGLPLLASALSVCAMILVLFDTSFNNTDDGVALSPVNRADEQVLSALVAEQVKVQVAQQREVYQQANQVLFKEYAQALAAQQAQSNTQLTQYLLASSREERKQDFAELIQFINDQRIDDQRFYSRQFSKLQDEIDGIGMGYSAVFPTPNLASSEDE